MRRHISTVLLAILLAVFTGVAGETSVYIFMANLGAGANAFAVIMAGLSGLFAYMAIVLPVLYWKASK
jgi:hypothetical protein